MARGCGEGRCPVLPTTTSGPAGSGRRGTGVNPQTLRGSRHARVRVPGEPVPEGGQSPPEGRISIPRRDHRRRSEGILGPPGAPGRVGSREAPRSGGGTACLTRAGDPPNVVSRRRNGTQAPGSGRNTGLGRGFPAVGVVWVLFVNSIACLFVFDACFFVLSGFLVGICLLGCFCGWVGFSECFCSESLILAQDERWRRA